MGASLIQSRENDQPTQWQVSGDIDFGSANQLRLDGIAAIEQAAKLAAPAAHKHCEFDFSAVTSVNTVALSLLLSWLRNGQRRGVEVSFSNLPSELHAIAEISELQALVHPAG